jgi:hypothetical protein
MTSTTRQLKEVREQVERLCEDLARTGRDQSEREPLLADQAAERALSGVHSFTRTGIRTSRAGLRCLRGGRANRLRALRCIGMPVTAQWGCRRGATGP